MSSPCWPTPPFPCSPLYTPLPSPTALGTRKVSVIFFFFFDQVPRFFLSFQGAPSQVEVAATVLAGLTSQRARRALERTQQCLWPVHRLLLHPGEVVLNEPALVEMPRGFLGTSQTHTDCQVFVNTDEPEIMGQEHRQRGLPEIFSSR